MVDIVAVPVVKVKKNRAENKFEKQKQVVKEAIINATAKFKKDNNYTDDIVGEDADVIEISRLMEYWRINFNSTQSRDLAKIFSIITKKTIKDVSVAARNINWTKFAAVIVLNGANHNYLVNKIAIVTADQKAIREDGTYGNVAYNSHLSYRPATPEEIDKITDETYASLIREFLIMA